MFEPDSGEELTPSEPAPPGVQKCVRRVTYICVPLSHLFSSCIAIFYWYDAMFVIFKKVNDGYQLNIWNPEGSYNQLWMLHKVPLLFGLVFLTVFAIVAMVCLLVAFCKEVAFLLIPYIAFHLVFIAITIGEVAVHVYYTEEGISVSALYRVLMVLATSIGIFIVLVFKKVAEMGKFTSTKTMVRPADLPIPYDNEMRKMSNANFIRNPGARASVVSSQRVDNWVPSTAHVA